MKRGIRRASLTLAILAVGSRPAPGAETEVPTNAVCPVTTTEPVKPNVFTEYEDRRIWFCCPRCRKKFLEDPTAYVGNLPALAERIRGAGPVSAVQPQGLGRLVRFLGAFHPVAIHFPIALLLLAALAEGLSLLSPRPFLTDAVRVSLLLGALSAVLAAALGWAAAAFASFPGELTRVLFLHRWVGTGTAVLAAIAAGLSEASRRKERPGLRRACRLTLFGSAALAGLSGYLGGALIYGPEHYTW